MFGFKQKPILPGSRTQTFTACHLPANIPLPTFLGPGLDFYSAAWLDASSSLVANALTVLVDVDDTALGVGSMASIGALIGHLLGGQSLRNDIGLVNNVLSRGPDVLPGLSLGGEPFWGCLQRSLK